MRIIVLALGVTVAGSLVGRDQTSGRFEQTFSSSAPGEAVAVVHASCAGCSWGDKDREAAAVRISLDDRYSQHLLLARGSDDSDYRITLGAVSAGPHHLVVEPDRALSAPSAGEPRISRIDVEVLSGSSDAALAQSLAPFVYARPNTVGRFTDLPVLMWYKVQRTPRGRQFRYSVIFTNEDGGTATDRLMATWGRTTDIEYIYGAEVDSAGKVIAEEFQGPGHAVPAFGGRHEGGHPLMWVSTDNNMVSESGPTEIRYAPAPEGFDLTDVSREEVMDRHAWSYTLAAAEMVREGKIDESAAPGSGRMPNARRFVHVEACTELENAAVTFSIRATDSTGTRWYDADGGMPAFRIVRSGCFRGAVPLPTGAGRADAIRLRACSLPSRPSSAAATSGPGSVTLLRINKVFGVGERYQPLASLFHWTGRVPLPIDGDWREFPIP